MSTQYNSAYSRINAEEGKRTQPMIYRAHPYPMILAKPHIQQYGKLPRSRNGRFYRHIFRTYLSRYAVSFFKKGAEKQNKESNAGACYQ